MTSIGQKRTFRLFERGLANHSWRHNVKEETMQSSEGHTMALGIAWLLHVLSR